MNLDAPPKREVSSGVRGPSLSARRTGGEGRGEVGLKTVDERNPEVAPGSVSILFLLVFAVLLTGCASTPKVDWNSRIGTFTYDQAVLELGPPDRSTKLGDGTTVADWVERGSRGGVSFGLGTGISSGNVGIYGGPTISSRESSRILRLTFGTDGKLTGFKRLNQ